MSWFKRIWAFLRQRRLDNDLDEELSFHLEMRTNHFIKQGMPPEEARLAARRKFGNVTRIKEDTRSSWGFAALESLWQDVCFGFRMLSKNRLSSMIAVLSLALGVGAGTGIWTGVNAFLLRPPPLYHDPDRLITAWETPSRDPRLLEQTSVPMYTAWRQESDLFEAMAAAETGVGVNVRFGDYPDRMEAKRISSEMLPLLGVGPLLGRNFTRADEKPGSDPVAILDYRTWEREFESRPDIIGQFITLDGRDHSIVGVLPERFWFFDIFTQIWLPLRMDSSDFDLESRHLQVIARLKPGKEVAQAQTNLASLASLVRAQYAGTEPARDIRVEPLIGARLLHTSIPRGIVRLMGAIAFVLLIACTNIANIMVGRSLAREREMGIRRALGAGRWRVLRQFLIESLIMAAAGGGLGLIGSLWITNLFRTNVAPIARYFDFSTDGRVIAFVLAITLATTLLAGLAPALLHARSGLTHSLRQGSAGSGTHISRQRVRRTLVVAEVALTLTLLVAALLEVKSFQGLDGTSMGFDGKNVLSFRVELPKSQDSGAPAEPPDARRSRALAFQQKLLLSLENLPGVRSAASVGARPLLDSAVRKPVMIPGLEQPLDEQEMRAAYNPVSPSFFETLRVTLMRGRHFTESDSQGAPWVAIINEAMARRYWPDQDPTGRYVRILDNDGEKPRQIVGVVANVQNRQILQPPVPEIFVPYHQQSGGESLLHMNYVVRTAQNPLDLAPVIREAVAAIDPKQAVWGLGSLERVLESGASEMLQGLFIQGVIIGMALLLSGIGIYGVLSYSIGRRTQEMGIRMALGADRNKLLTLILGEGLALTAIGLLVGVALALGVTRFLQGAVFEMEAAGPLEFLLSLPPVLLAAAVASYLPARRAAKLNPSLALRNE